MDMQQLVALQYTQNTYYTEAVSASAVPDLTVDLEKGTWCYRNQERKIDQKRTCERGTRDGVIGIYNRANNASLTNMLRAAQEAVRETVHVSPWSD